MWPVVSEQARKGQADPEYLIDQRERCHFHFESIETTMTTLFRATTSHTLGTLGMMPGSIVAAIVREPMAIINNIAVIMGIAGVTVHKNGAENAKNTPMGITVSPTDTRYVFQSGPNIILPPQRITFLPGKPTHQFLIGNQLPRKPA